MRPFLSGSRAERKRQRALWWREQEHQQRIEALREARDRFMSAMLASPPILEGAFEGHLFPYMFVGEP